MRLTLRDIFRFLCAAALSLGVVGYLGYHSLYGRKGLLALEIRDHEHAVLTGELERLQASRQTLQRRSKALVPPVRRDMLEEQARLSLNYVHPDEKVLLLDDLLPPQR